MPVNFDPELRAMLLDGKSRTLEADVEALKAISEVEQIEDKSNPIEAAVLNIKQVVSQQDADRMQSITSLINTFNFAVQVQANRVQWQVSDTKAFLIALCAIDAIGKTATE